MYPPACVHYFLGGVFIIAFCLRLFVRTPSGTRRRSATLAVLWTSCAATAAHSTLRGSERSEAASPSAVRRVRWPLSRSAQPQPYWRTC